MERINEGIGRVFTPKVLRRIFFTILAFNLILGADAALTTMGIVTTPSNDLVPTANWGIRAGGSSVFFIVETDIPNWGFITKEFDLRLKVNLGPENIEEFIIHEDYFVLGEPNEITINFLLSSTLSRSLENQGFLDYSIFIQVTPLFAGLEFSSAARTITIYGSVVS